MTSFCAAGSWRCWISLCARQVAGGRASTCCCRY
jgi:hypothetical protein